MRRYILDTGIASDFINRRLGVYERAQAVASGDRIGIGMPILGELWGGIYLSHTYERNRTRLKKNLVEFYLWPFDAAAAERYGRLFAELRQRGRPMQPIDIQIAAIALSLGNCTVVTKGHDFRAIAGLNVVNWSISP